MNVPQISGERQQVNIKQIALFSQHREAAGWLTFYPDAWNERASHIAYSNLQFPKLIALGKRQKECTEFEPHPKG